MIKKVKSLSVVFILILWILFVFAIGCEESVEPKKIGSFKTSGEVTSIFVEDNYAYLLCKNEGLKIIDMESKDELKEIRSYIPQIDHSFIPLDMAFTGNMAFLMYYDMDPEKNCGSGPYIREFDISVESKPPEIDWDKYLDVEILEAGGALYMNDNYLYVYKPWGRFNFLEIYKTINLEDSIGILDLDEKVSINDIFIDDDCAYLAYSMSENKKTLEGGLLLVDVADKKNPEIINVSFHKEVTGNKVFVKENYIYLTYYIEDYKEGGLKETGLYIMQNIDGEISFLSNVLTKSRAEGLYVKDNYAFVADGSSGIQIIDISNQKRPKLVSEVQTSDRAFDVFAIDEFLYIATEGGFEIFNLK